MSQLDRLRSLMSAKGVGALLVSDATNVAWLTGFVGSFSRVLVTADKAQFITDSRYTLQAQEQVQYGIPTASFATPVTGDEFVATKAKEMGITELYFEAVNTSYDAFLKTSEKLQGIKLLPAEDLFGALRQVKTPDEIANVRAACGIADATFEYLRTRIQPGITEYDLNLDLEFFIRRQGADVAFTPIVVSGERSARPHGKASEKKLEVGDFLTMDFGATVNGYHSDITRTVVVGEASDRHREVYGQVLKSQLAALEMMKPGVKGVDIDRKVREVMDEKDLSKYFGHGLGHGLGRLVHDTGRLGQTSIDVLEPGQIWTIEPGVYIPGFGGVRIEDDVVVTDDGIEILTKSTKELLVLPAV